MQREFQLAIVIDGNGQALIAELDETTGAIKKTHKATDLLGEAAEDAGKKSERGSKGFSTMGDRASKLKTNIQGATVLLAKMAGFITGALGVGMSVGVSKTIEFGDQVNKLRTRIGASTEALSEYSHVAKLTGVEFNQLTIGWQRQTRRISEAARGFGEAQGALKELGLEAKDLKDLKPEDQFEIIADRMALVTEESDRVRIGMKLWDSEGVALLQTIDGGSEALRRMRQEARDLGKSLSQEQAQQMSAAKDASTKLQGAVEGLTTSMAVNLAPTLANVTNFVTDELLPTFTNWLDKIGAIDLAISDMSRKQAQFTLGEVQEEIAELTSQQEKLQEKQRGLSFAGKFFIGGAVSGTLEDIANKLAQLSVIEFDAEQRLKALDDQLKKTAGSMGELGEGAGTAGTRVKTMLEQFSGEATALQQFIGALQTQTATLGLSEDAVLRHTAAQLKAQLQDQALAPAIDQLVEGYIAGKLAADEMAAAEQSLNEARALQVSILDQLKSKYDPVTAAIDKWTEVEKELLTLVDDEKTDQAELTKLLKLVALARDDEAQAAEDQQHPHRQLIENLGLENEALALAIANSESLEIAKARLNGATETEIASLKRLQAENENLKNQYGGLTEEVDAFGVAINRGIERLDDAFQDMWRNVFSDTKNNMASLKNLVLDTLAEIVHSVTTRQLSAQISAAFSGGSGNDSGQLGGQLGGLFGGLFGGVGGGDYSTAPGFVGPPSPAGGGSTALNGAAAGAMAIPIIGWIIAAFMANLSLVKSGWNVGETLDSKGKTASRLAGGGGPLLADKLLRSFGFSDKQASIWAGTGIFSALFGRKPPKLTDQGIQGSYSGTGVTGDQFFNFKAKGGLFRSDKYSQETAALGEIGEFFNEVIDQITGFGKSLAEQVGVDVGDALNNLDIPFSLTLDADPEKAEQQIKDFAEQMGQDVIGAMASAFGDRVQEFVGDTIGIDAQLARLTTAAQTLDLINNEALLIDRTFGEFLTVAEDMQGWGEDTNDALQRLLQTVQLVAEATRALSDLSLLDPVEAYRQQLELSSRTVFQSIDPLTDAMSLAMSGFDGTAESFLRVTQAAADLRGAQILLAGQYIELEAQIAGFGKSIEDRIQQELLGDAGFYDLLNDRFQAQSANLQTLTDPQEIAAALALLEETAGNMISLLSPEQIQAQGGDILDVLAAVRADAEARRLLGLDGLQDGAIATGTQIDVFMSTLGDPLEIAAGKQVDAAEDLIDAADDISDAADRIVPPADDYGAVGGGRLGKDIHTAVLHGIADGATHAAQISQNVATEVARTLSNLPAELARAVYQGVAQIKVQVVVPNSGGRTNA